MQVEYIEIATLLFSYFLIFIFIFFVRHSDRFYPSLLHQIKLNKNGNNNSNGNNTPTNNSNNNKNQSSTILELIIRLCVDNDSPTRKFACFAGNEKLYSFLLFYIRD